MEHIFQYIGKAFVTVALAIAGLFGGGQPVDQNVGATIPIPVAVFQTSLQESISSSATSMTLVTGTDKSGDALSGYICFNLDEGTSLEEFVCGTAAGTAVTSMIRGLDPVDGDLEVTALKKAHRRGASVKVTNYPSLGILSRILNGLETIPAAITYATGVGPSASSDLADKEYVLSVVNGGPITLESLIVAGVAGGTVAAGNLVYLKASDGRWWKTDADTAATVENVSLGVAQGAGTAGNSITSGVLIKGLDSNQTGLSANTVYYASNTAGALSSSAGTKEVTIGVALSTTSINFDPRYNQKITEDEQDALSGGSGFGTPSATNKYLTEDYNFSVGDLPVVRTYTASTTTLGGATSQFDITNPAGSTFRYTWDGTGTDPGITAGTVPTNTKLVFYAQNLTGGDTNNNRSFIVTGSGANYFEVTNTSGVAANNAIIGTGGYLKLVTAQTWTKPAGLKYAIVEVQAAGGAGGGAASDGNAGGGGGGGGYAKELLATASLGSTESLYVGPTITMTVSTTTPGPIGSSASITAFGSLVSATGGDSGASNNNNVGGANGGIGVGGDINVGGGDGGAGFGNSATFSLGGIGGSAYYGGGGASVVDSSACGAGNNYGGGGGGAAMQASGGDGGSGGPAIIIVTEYYN